MEHSTLVSLIQGIAIGISVGYVFAWLQGLVARHN